MDTTTDDKTTLLDDLPPGGQTRFSTVVGAVGNYGLIGTLGALALKQGHKIATKDPTALKFDKITGISAAVIGVLSIGGLIHGFKEADDIQNYRESVAKKIDGLGREITADREKIAELTRAVHAKAEGHHAQRAR
jgi:hypothetical protein